MKILVYGGSFDPPHLGHSKLLNAACARLRPDRIEIVPAFRSPFKGTATAPTSARVAMARAGLLELLPARWRGKARINLTEIRARRQVYTYETLARLKGERHFVCGQDSACSFPRWKNAKDLERLATWWYGRRPGSRGRIPAHFRRIPGSFPDVSSTELRSALALGRDCSDFLHPSVARIIDERGLYGWKLLARLRETLSPERFEHTLNVASLAESLAARHGAAPESALLAGLLHDMGRRFNPAGVARYVKAHRVEVPREERVLALEPMLAHAYVSADLAKKEFAVDDEEVLEAVRRHTLGAARMSPLDKVLYVADACSADRSHPGVAKTRALAFKDLDAALKRCVKEKLAHARARGAWIHPLTLRLWNSLARR